MTRVGLVLGAGGVVGQAYHAGVLAVLEHDFGFDPRAVDVIVGTSAGPSRARCCGSASRPKTSPRGRSRLRSPATTTCCARSPLRRCRSTDAGRDAVIGQEPIGRMGRPEEIPSTVHSLCSDLGGFTVGHALVVDGGQTAGL